MSLFVLKRFPVFNVKRIGVFAAKQVNLRFFSAPCGSPTEPWSSNRVRQTFIDYFCDLGFSFIPSSSVVPRSGEGSYFINAGMNQFKPLFLGTIDPQHDWCQLYGAVNSQKCIRVGGKHNDLDDVGFDSYHHTFFEMLGFWIFKQSDDMKYKSCMEAWDLLTKVYKLPPDRLFVTYFKGDDKLPPDLQTKDIWLKLGVPSNRILPFGKKDNFWEMGETGPCGPCTEIHYSYKEPSRHTCDDVNNDCSDVIEIWNIVFMQYNRSQDGCLHELDRHFVDTGMGLERISSVLQGHSSNYSSDLFMSIIKEIEKISGVRCYGNKYDADDPDGVDRAYRIIADHFRMISVAMSDGLVPGRSGLDMKVRRVLHRALQQSRDILKCPPSTISTIIPHVIRPLSDAFPELLVSQNKIMKSIDSEERRYLVNAEGGRETIEKLMKSGEIQNRRLTGTLLLGLYLGDYGAPLSLDLIRSLSSLFNLSADWSKFNELLEQHQTQLPQGAGSADGWGPERTAVWGALSGWLEEHDQEIPLTDDQHKYVYHKDGGHYVFKETLGEVLCIFSGEDFVADFPASASEINSSKEASKCYVILNKTCFYAESGGQSSDKGVLYNEGFRMAVDDVTLLNGRVVHSGTVLEGTVKLGDKLHCKINEGQRLSHMRNHTATHLLGHSLDAVLGGLNQRGSSINASRLTYDFTCDQLTLSRGNILEVNDLLQRSIKDRLRVYRETLPYQEAMEIEKIRTLNEVYPSKVHVISIGQPCTFDGDGRGEGISKELCGGTHVCNTEDIQDIVITNISGVAQGTKRVTAITGQLAQKARSNVIVIRQRLEALKDLVEERRDVQRWKIESQEIWTRLQEFNLPKLDREDLTEMLEDLEKRKINESTNTNTKQYLAEILSNLLNQHHQESFVVALFEFAKTRLLLDAIIMVEVHKPLLLLCRPQRFKNSPTDYICTALCFVPQGLNDVTADEWSCYLSKRCEGRRQDPKDGKKMSKIKGDVKMVTFKIEAEDQRDCDRKIQEVKRLAEGYMSSRIHRS